MTIQLINHTLDVVIASLIHGSEIWLAVTFILYVMGRQRHRPLKIRPDVRLSAQPSAPFSNPSSILLTDHHLPLEYSDLKRLPQTSVSPTAEINVTGVAYKPTKLSMEMPPKVSLKPAMSPPQIVCEPVDWKQWRVSDLRKASLCKACGIRIRPIGSPRKLPKADLIAQYQQSLRRLTPSPFILTVAHSKTA